MISYTKEFKESAIRLAQESSQPIVKTAEELGLKPSTLYNWLAKYREQLPPEGDEDQRAAIRKLKKEVAQLTVERDILKKAAAYFAGATK